MNKLLKISNFKTIAILLFALFLLIAPCSVRNYFETQLGIENTQTLNRNKTTILQSNVCNVWENPLQKSITEKYKKDVKNECIPIIGSANFKLFSFEIQNDIPYINLGENLKTALPFYILYKRLKVML
ncbi:hypothetical protein ACMDB5_12610 [Flavobacterium sp. W1B]|uniref:hypothetical protein n=1 Tax=Flavobacterium sp. W1B TaxID=3394146 RepID=UPI0039BD7933